MHLHGDANDVATFVPGLLKRNYIWPFAATI
jgi:hypothetical protein